jgi:phosphate-selective porin OprO and OprP
MLTGLLIGAQPLGAQFLGPQSPEAEPLETPVSGRSLAAQAPPAPEREEDEQRDWGVRWDDRPSFYVGRHTTISLRARLQGHLRDSEAPLGDATGFDLARRRVGVEGRLFGIVDFEVDHEIGHDEAWRDVYVEYGQFAVARVRAGRFKLPFSLDENTSATNLDFVYRSRAASQLAPGRDPGVMVSGRLLPGGVVRYEAGWFTNDGRNARTRNPERVSGDRTLAARVIVQPFRASRSALRDLQAGVAMTGSEVPEGMAALRGRTALDTSFFPADVWVHGHRRRTGLELRWRPGPFSLKSEYIRASTERRGQSVEDGALPPLIGSGWYVSGTWLATGERKAAGPQRPRRPLFKGGAGAIELAARLESLDFGSTSAIDPVHSTSPRAETVLGNRDLATTLGVNWYPYAGVKIQANVIRESFSEPTYAPLPAQPSFWSSVLRIQFSL